ncbi:MAG: primosomal protein N', partial [Fervidobacterium sp.]
KMPYEEFKKMKNFNKYISNNLVRIYRDFETKKPKPRKVSQYVILKLPSNKLTSIKLTARQSVVVNYLLFNGSGFCMLDQLIEDTDISKDVIVQLVNKGVVKISEHAPTSTLEGFSKSINKVSQKTVLTEEQAEVVKNILSHHVGEKHLIFGPTGSGKTEVYLRVMEEYLSIGTVLYLVPEVSLTEQTVARIRGKFPDLSIGIYHSYMSKSKRVETWAKAVKGELDILVGTRSAVFVPLKNIKLVIVDEEHDESYYNDNEPYYDVHTLLDNLPVTVLYGSATPALGSYKKALDGLYVLNKLTKRYSTDLPNVEIVDMKKERKRTPSISQKLAETISDTLSMNKSAIVFTRRKGFSRVQCAVCGYIIKCDHCDVSMTYHLDSKKLVCHLCGSEKEINFSCPSCGASLFIDKGTGTEKVEKELKEIFPGRNVIRIDAEIIDEFEKLSKILSALREGNVDILAGTKMITKGLDIYRIGLVGVIDVDALISYPDINASLRTFQLLVQVIGRAGRKEQGRAIIQTYNPKDPVISYAVAQDVEGFYNRELKMRKELKYPPFFNVIQITYANLDNNLARDTLDAVANELEMFLYQLPKEYQENGEYNEEYKDIEILGPSEHPILKAANKYRYQLIIKTHNTINLLKLIRKIIARFPGEWTIKVNPPEI